MAKRKGRTKTKASIPAQARTNVYNPVATMRWLMSPRFVQQSESFEDAYSQNGTVWACIRRIVTNIAGVPLLVKTGDRKNGKVVESGPWVDLFERINEQMDPQLFMEALGIHLTEPCGEVVIAFKSKSGNTIGENEVPYEMYPLSGKLFNPVMEKGKIVKWEYSLPGSPGKQTLLPHEIVRIRSYNPSNTLRGIGELQPGTISARADWKANVHNEAILDNGGSLGGVITTPPDVEIDPEWAKSWKLQQEDKVAGYDKAGRWLFLERGMQFVWNPTSLQSLQFIDSRKFNRTEIAMIFGVPEEELTGTANANMITGVGRLSSNRNFWSMTLLPMMAKITSAFYGQLMRRIDGGKYWIEFDLDTVEALKANLRELLDAAAKLRDLGYPVNAINERLNLGMPEFPHLDIALVPPGYMPADDLTVEDDWTDEPPPPPPPPPPDAEDEDEEDEDEEPVEAGRAAPDAHPELTAEWARIAGVSLVPWELKLRARFRRYLMALRSAQLRLTENPAIPVESLFDLAEWTEKLQKAHEPLYDAMAQSAIDKAEQEIEPITKKRARPQLAKEIAKDRIRILGKVNETIRKKIARQISIGISKNESREDIAARVRTVYNGVSKKWSRVIARTEVSGVVNEARYRTMTESGVMSIQWVTAQDERVRPSHAALHGEIRQLGVSFPNGLRYPQDAASGNPGETINCRCIAKPIKV